MKLSLFIMGAILGAVAYTTLAGQEPMQRQRPNCKIERWVPLAEGVACKTTRRLGARTYCLATTHTTYCEEPHGL